MIQRTGLILVLGIVLAGALSACKSHTGNGPLSDGIDEDERVVFFPTDGWRSEEGTRWHLRIHGWIFEPEKGNFIQNQVLNLAESYFEDEVMNDARRKRFEKRLRYFIHDNEGGKELTVRLGGNRYLMPESDGDGRFETTITVPDRTVQKHANGDTLTFEALPGSKKRTPPTGTIHLMEPKGITVISDIDDTIKISHAHDRTELLRRTFLMPYEAVPDMADTYHSWQQRMNVQFIYLSAAPWQLYPSLKPFMDRSGFPGGPVDLHRVQLDDARLFNLFDSPLEKKLSRVLTYLRRYPKRDVVLIGDSGEKDPELYGTVARKFPDRVRAIYIHRVGDPESNTPDRFQNAFDQVPDEKWTVFDEAGELPDRMKFETQNSK